MHRRFGILLTAIALGTLAGCSEDEVTLDYSAEMEAAQSSYAEIVSASYADSLEGLLTLDQAIAAFLDAPSEDGLADARTAWKSSREPYLQTEVYRFYDGPIDDPDDGPEGLINAWPMDEAYVDYVIDDEEVLNGGIVNDPEIPINGQELEGLNEDGGEKNIATGYHAVEFLLWGQDLSTDGAGERPYTDYVDGAGGTAENQARRAEYLRTASSLLIGHLEDLVDAWTDGDESNYRAEFETVEPKEAFRRILTGMIVLSGFETGGERLQTALDSKDQEDEHSCFSDNTHRDMVQDVQGILNVWDGTYRSFGGLEFGGSGVKRVVEKLDTGLAGRLDAQIHESLELANLLQAPFDREIVDDNPAGRERVQELITSLRAQSDMLAEVFRKLELEVPDTTMP